jgi:hypothetical protein
LAGFETNEKYSDSEMKSTIWQDELSEGRIRALGKWDLILVRIYHIYSPKDKLRTHPHQGARLIAHKLSLHQMANRESVTLEYSLITRVISLTSDGVLVVNGSP